MCILVLLNPLLHGAVVIFRVIIHKKIQKDYLNHFRIKQDHSAKDNETDKIDPKPYFKRVKVTSIQVEVIKGKQENLRDVGAVFKNFHLNVTKVCR